MQEEKEKNDLVTRMDAEAPNPSDSVSMMDQHYTNETPLLNQDPQPIQEDQDFSSPRISSSPIKIDYSQSNIDEIEELIESVVDEKWRDFGNIGIWKEKVRQEVGSIKQELIRLENRFENLQKAILNKVRSYDENIIEVGSNIKALEKVFSKILDPLTSNIKDLDKITKELKKR